MIPLACKVKMTMTRAMKSSTLLVLQNGIMKGRNYDDDDKRNDKL
jgi:hypothetical protein